MSEIRSSEQYIEVCLKVTGRNLDAKFVNPIIRRYNSILSECLIEEEENGKIFKAWVADVSDFKHELLDKNVLVCSRQVKFEIRDSFIQGGDRTHQAQVKLHDVLMGIKIDDNPSCSGNIIIETTNTHISGNMREGRWPRDQFDGVRF